MATLAVDYAWVPYPTQVLQFPPYYSLLRDSRVEGAVLDIPLASTIQAAPNARDQTRHGRPIVGGYVTAPSLRERRPILNNPALSNLAELAPPLDRPIELDPLRALGIAKIVMHKDRTSGFCARELSRLGPGDVLRSKRFMPRKAMQDADFEQIRNELQNLAGLPEYEDERIIVFGVQ